MKRKDFLIQTTCAGAVAATLAYLDSCTKPSSVNFTLDLSNTANATLNHVGGYVIANNGSVIVMRNSSGFEALSLICTHQGCTVNYTGSGFVCPCHGGTYNINGAVTGGPPPSALAQYTVTQSGTVLTIKG